MGVQLVTPESIGTFVAVAAGTTPPSSAPVLSLSSYTDTTIDVSCTSVSGATGYKFYKGGVLVATQAGTTYQYTGLTFNTAYALTCTAYNGGGESAASNTVNQTTSIYKTLSDPTKQKLWADLLNLGCTDTAGATLAVANDLIWTVRIPTGWSPGGDNLIRQNTSSKRPTLKSDGAQCTDTARLMALPATITLSGDFTIYYVANRSASNQNLVWAGRASDTNSLISFNDGNFYFWAGSSPKADTATGLRIRRARRSGTTVTTTIGGTDATQSDSSTLTLNQILARQDPANQCTSASARTLGVVIVSSHLTPGGADDLGIIASLQALYSGVSGP